MSRGRRRTVKALVVLGSVLAFLSVFGIWIERQALNTDDWVHTSARMLQNSTIRTAISDYLVDQLYDQVYHELIVFMLNDPRTIERATHITWIAHNLERIADRATNICERVVYMEQGKYEELNVSKY